MTVLHVIFGPTFWILDLVLRLYMWVIIARALVSWVDPNPYNPVVRTLRLVTDPVLRPLQRLQWRISRGRMPIDFSPLVAVLAILFIRRLLYELALVLLLRPM